MNNEKFIRSAKIIDRILKILQGFMIAGCIVCAIFIPLTFIFGEKVIAKSDETITLGIMILKLTDPSYVNYSNVNKYIIPMLVLTIVICVIAWYGMKVLRDIFKPLKEGSPFEKGISIQIRKLAWISLIGGTIYEIGKAVLSVCECKMYDLSMLLNSDAVASYSYKIAIDGNFIIIAIILFLISYIFRYGEMLQQESDETL